MCIYVFVSKQQLFAERDIHRLYLLITPCSNASPTSRQYRCTLPAQSNALLYLEYKYIYMLSCFSVFAYEKAHFQMIIW